MLILEERRFMTVGIIDADLIGRPTHRFPNLACMKISSYYKNLNHEVKLLENYDEVKNYDKVFISKVFMDTEIPFEPEDKSLKTEEYISEFYKNNPLLTLSNIEYGGTGFFYDKAKPLPYEIEHSYPDYHLYDGWINRKMFEGIDFEKYEKDESYKKACAPVIKKRKTEFAYYTDYSIGFVTRGCIRGCSFCVNKNYKKCLLHSPVSEFLDESRPYICLLDDNVLACKDWKKCFEELIATGKRFQFKQGCDERLLTDEKCDYIFNKSKWIGDKIFAFDNIADKNLIENKLQMIRRHTEVIVKFYTFCAYNHSNKGEYDDLFWSKDIEDLFHRIKILMKYKCLPYVMRYKDYVLSPYKGIYVNVARWCNQPNMLKKMTFAEFCKISGMSRAGREKYNLDFNAYLINGGKKGSSWLAYENFEQNYPEIAKKYFHMRWSDF